MVRKFHNHKLQTNPWHCEEEPHSNHEALGKQTKQSNQISLPHLLALFLSLLSPSLLAHLLYSLFLYSHSFPTHTPSLLALILSTLSFSNRTPSLLAFLFYSHSFSTLSFSTRTPSLLSFSLLTLLYLHSFSTRTPSLLALLLYSLLLYSYSF